MASQRETDPLVTTKSDDDEDFDENLDQPHRVLGTFALAGMIFFTATGGAYGTEATVRAVGPALTLLAFAVVPFFWSLPQAMYTSELSTALPVDGGISVWGRVAWSEFWGFQGGLWAWLEGVSTLAAYPTVTVAYLQILNNGAFEPVEAWCIKAAIATAFCALNLRGIDWVGASAGTLAIFVLAPLVVFTVMGVPDVDVNVWTDTRAAENLNWTYFVNLMLWNLSGYDNVGAVSGEVHQPAVTVPRAQIIAVIGGSLAFMLPLMVGTGVAPDWGKWHEGYFAVIAHKIGGNWLMIWILIGAAVARSSNFMAELCTNSFFLQGMGAQAMLPSVFAWRHPKYDTPMVAILFNFALVLIIMTLDLTEILQLANLFTAASYILGISCLLKLRELRPVQYRDQGAFSVPLTVTQFLIWLIPAFLLVGATVYVCTRIILLLAMFVFGIGHATYFFLQYCRQKKYLHFVEPPTTDDIHEVWYVM